MIIYETHVRSFTMDSSSGVRHPGTFDGLLEKLPYLLSLGVNTIELMPIFEFDEMADERIVDGFYYAAFFKHYKRILAHPEILDKVPEEVLPDID